MLENVACEGTESSPSECSRAPLGRVLSSECQNPSTDAAGIMCSLRLGIMISVVSYPQWQAIKFRGPHAGSIVVITSEV